MTAVLKRNLLQTAIYWPPGTPDGLGGHSYGQAVEVACRWQNVSVIFRDARGEQVVSSAVVYVDRVVQIKGFLALSSFEEDLTYASPNDVTGSTEIRQVALFPALRNDKQIVKVYL